jgi:nuclear pore complex protein Nup54
MKSKKKIYFQNINAATKPNDVDHFMNALINAQVFNDERDAIIAKWNQLQAFYGFGKIFYQNTSLDVSKDNHLTRFKVRI